MHCGICCITARKMCRNSRQRKSKTPLQATGYQTCSAAERKHIEDVLVFDPRGSRQMLQTLGSLLAGINNQKTKDRKKQKENKKQKEKTKRKEEFPMKKINYACIFSILWALALTGCSSLPSVPEAATDAAAHSDYISVGSCLTVHNTDERLTLRDNMDALSADGLYYASWTAGSAEPYENTDGDTIDLYDAQLYLLSGEYKNAESAENSMAGWLAAGHANYNVTAEETVTCNGQTYTLLTYYFTNEENPYSKGVSAFGVCGNCAVCMELTCQTEYSEDLHEMLIAFLNGCSYQ